MKHLFIDTNIYLTFYHFSSDDLEELKKLLVAVDSGKIELHITKQVITEFRRNREAKIAHALKIFNAQKLPDQFPQICKGYAEYSTLRGLLRSFSDVRTQLLDALKSDIDSNKCGADIITDGLFDKAHLLELDDDVIDAARRRIALGNPPGSNYSIGDAINWQLLLKHFPDDEELHLITGDTKDYSSRIEKGRLSEFLAVEWQEHGKSPLHYYTKLSDFLRNEFPNIRLASELEKDLAIDSFANSPTFASTKSAIRKLRRITDFSDSEIAEIVEASTANNQIYWIHEDYIVRSFLFGVIKGREDAIDPELLEKFHKIYGNEAAADSPEEEDLPFD